MVWQKLLLATGMTVVLGFWSHAGAANGASSSGCTPAQILHKECSFIIGSNNGDSVTLTGGSHSSTTDPGRLGLWIRGNTGSSDAVAVDTSRPLRDNYGVTRAVTLRDIAHFRPTPGTDNMEPNGWMVVGLPTNFYAITRVQVHNGTLLGQPAAVRFTPRTYRWNYGDGATASKSTAGATWRAQGVREFDPTQTSHIFTAKRSYTITLTIDFGAEYRYDGGAWTRIAGTVAIAANPLTASAGDARTVLVASDCGSNPSGPGC